MHAVLLADENHHNFHAIDFFRVYSDYVLEQLDELVTLKAEPVFLSEFDRKQDTLMNAEIIFSNWGMPELSLEDSCKYLPRVKAVFYAGGDVSVFALPFFQRNVRIFSTGHANAIPASEYTLAQILLSSKYAQRCARAYKDADSYDKLRNHISTLHGNYQLSVGILGVGRVGSKLAELLNFFDIKVYGCDPFLSPQRARELGLILTDMDDIFTQCDIVSCHLPDWDSLHSIIGYDQFNSMSKNGVFINASQAGPIDQDGLIRAFNEVQSRTAILDSTDPMPLPKEHPLLSMQNVFITPHIAGSFGGELERMGMEVVSALKAFLGAKPTAHEVFRN